MGDDLVRRVCAHALGLAEGMTKDSPGVRELITIAGGDRAALEAARARIEDDAGGRRTEPTDAMGGTEMAGDSDTPQAPALLAVRLLTDAIVELTGEDEASRP